MSKLLILTASTGGGHDMRANAFARWCARSTDWNVEIYRPLEQGHKLYRFGVDAYNWIQQMAPRLHHGYFGFLELAGLHRKAGRILNAERFLSVLEEVQPDVIISTHAHLNHGYLELARKKLGRSNVSFVTYCGELGGGYGFSRHWVNPEVDLFIGAVDETVDAAIDLGMPTDRAWTGGFMLFPEFFDDEDVQLSKKFVIEILEMNPDDFILLLAVGAAGANNHLEILESLERREVQIQVVALCGRNEKTFTRISTWAQQASMVKLKTFRQRTDMCRILRAATAVVSRPGTGTTSETIMTTCPLIMNGMGGIMPQESVTVRYAKRHGLARVVRRVNELTEVLADWSQDATEREAMRRNMRVERPAVHPLDVLERLGSSQAFLPKRLHAAGG